MADKTHGIEEWFITLEQAYDFANKQSSGTYNIIVCEEEDGSDQAFIVREVIGPLYLREGEYLVDTIEIDLKEQGFGDTDVDY